MVKMVEVVVTLAVTSALMIALIRLLLPARKF